MNKKIFLNRWIDWTLAVIIIAFIIIWGAIQKYSIEQEYDFVGDDIFYSIRFHAKDKQPHGDYKNTTYRIDGKNVELKNGLSEIEVVPGSASKIVTRYFGNEISHDLDGDGTKDVAFLLTQETGGSGIFYYVVAALNTSNGYAGSQGLLLGDRIAPQSTEVGKGKVIVVNYADRAPGESFAIRPSVGKSIWLLLDPRTMQFGEVAQNFEGEADPKKMSLRMQSWAWVNTLYNNGTEIKPISKEKFKLTFNDEKKFSATTDCNSVGGGYLENKNEISFNNIFATKMYCEGSQEGDFIKMLEGVQSYHFTSKGELIFDLKFDSGSVIFR